ncbi:MAG: tetraacyldisaccharide 4'-kinase, partial [Bacteroidetes bacterium RIFCSPHIGHO2_02_FULL_44_7]
MSVGGTGKTPLVDYIVQHFLLQNKKLATLSRGYGRSTAGPQIVSMESTATEVGDETRMYKQKYGDQLLVAVAEKRKAGVELILKTQNNTNLIVLDDAFQHRAVKAGFSILVTEYNRPFFRDFMLPAGNLREAKIGRHRADLILVSKCPELSSEDKKRFQKALHMNGTPIFFSRIVYDKLKSFAHHSISDSIKNVLLVTGIGNPAPLHAYFKKNYRVEHLEFRDHHAFSAKDIRAIHEKFDTFASR